MKHLFLLLIGTFAMGIFSGTFVFFATQESESPIFTFEGTDVARGFEIIADSYGGCTRIGCVSYRISDDGSFSVLRSYRSGEDVRDEGKISGAALASLKQELKSTDFERLNTTEATGNCAADTDGLAYQYEIRIGEVVYRLNSCKQDLEGEKLFETLAEYFGTFGSAL